jgi:hypothetical protein
MSGLVGRLLLRFLAARWRDVCGPAADRVASVNRLDDALKLCRAVLNVCGARLQQKLPDGRTVLLGFGLKAEHFVRVLGEFLQQLVFHLFSAHVPIVVGPLPLFKLAARAAMRYRLADHDLDHETHDVARHVLRHELHDAMNHG